MKMQTPGIPLRSKQKSVERGCPLQVYAAHGRVAQPILIKIVDKRAFEARTRINETREAAILLIIRRPVCDGRNIAARQ